MQLESPKGKIKKNMTELIFKNRIDDMQMSILLYLLRSWNIETEILQKSAENQKKLSTDDFLISKQMLADNVINGNTMQKSFSQSFSKTRGMWADRDIDGVNLRNAAWGINKQTTV